MGYILWRLVNNVWEEVYEGYEVTELPHVIKVICDNVDERGHYRVTKDGKIIKKQIDFREEANLPTLTV